MEQPPDFYVYIAFLIVVCLLAADCLYQRALALHRGKTKRGL